MTHPLAHAPAPVPMRGDKDDLDMSKDEQQLGAIRQTEK